MGFYGILMGFNGIYDGYPLVKVDKKLWNIHPLFNGTTHYFDWAIFNSYAGRFIRHMYPDSHITSLSIFLQDTGFHRYICPFCTGKDCSTSLSNDCSDGSPCSPESLSPLNPVELEFKYVHQKNISIFIERVSDTWESHFGMGMGTSPLLIEAGSQ